MPTSRLKTLKEIMLLFLKLGLITFGGPAAHIALFEHEVVTKRQWMTRQHFLDLLGATNLIPGPNSTEMALHCGYHRAGFAGLLVAGLSFMLPAVLLTGLLAFIYAAYGKLPQVTPFLYGAKAAVIVIILNAVYKLGFKAIKGWTLAVIAAAVVVANFLGMNEVLAILGGGLFGLFFLQLFNRKNNLNMISPLTLLPLFALQPIAENLAKSEASLSKLFLSCLKIGAVWFGSGYILVAYFDGEFVQGLHWLTRQELLDAIAVGQITPGPFLSSATFIGYQIAGLTGAIAATVGIVLPSIFFVLMLNPLIPRIRNSVFLAKFLDAVNVSAVAVMVVVALKLGKEVLVDWPAWTIALLSLAAFLKFKNFNAAYAVLGGAVLGYVFYFLK